MRRTLKRTLAIAAILAPPPFADPALAAGCMLTMTESQCQDAVSTEAGRDPAQNAEPSAALTSARDRFLAELAREQAVQVSAAEEELANQLVPPANVLAALAGTKTDLYSALSLLIDSGSLSKDDNEVIQIDLSPFVGLDNNLFRLGASVGGASVYEPLAKALEAASLEESLSAAAEGLDDLSQVKVTGIWSPLNRKRGRSAARLADSMAALFDAARRSESELRDAQRRAADARDDFIQRVADRARATGTANPFETWAGPFEELPSPIGVEFMELVEEAARTLAEYLNGVDRELKAAHFPELPNLADNQPQLVTEVSYIHRDEAVGPIEVVGSASYEIGWPNLNQLASRCSETPSLSCFRGFVDGFGGAVTAGNRVSVKISYSELERFDFPLPDDAFQFSEDSERKIVYAFAYGRNLAVEDRVATRRLELTIDREDLEEGSLRNDRTKASLTLAQRINDTTSLVLGGVWASDPEFRGAVEEEVSAHFGLSYKLIKSNGEGSPDTP